MEEYKYIAKDKKMPKCVTDHLEIYSDEENLEEKDSDKWNSEEENSSAEQMFFFERGILRVCFFWACNSHNVFCKEPVLKKCFLRKQFLKFIFSEQFLKCIFLREQFLKCIVWEISSLTFFK